MILLPVDEAAAFDALAILYVKEKNGMVNPTYRDSVLGAIGDAIGYEKLTAIVKSEHFKNLMSVNLEIFYLVEAGNTVSAGVIRDTNLRRFHYKQELQRAFFNSDLTEDKSNLENHLNPRLEPA